MSKNEIVEIEDLSIEELKENLEFLKSFNLNNENLSELSDETFRKQLSRILGFEIKYHINVDSTIDETEFKINQVIIRYGEINNLLSKLPNFKILKLEFLNNKIDSMKKKITSRLRK